MQFGANNAIWYVSEFFASIYVVGTSIRAVHQKQTDNNPGDSVKVGSVSVSQLQYFRIQKPRIERHKKGWILFCANGFNRKISGWEKVFFV